MPDKSWRILETEKQFQAAVMALARINKWAFYHTHNSRHSAKGFPDLCLVRGKRLIFAELKTDKGRVSVDQELWLAALGAVEGIEVLIWRPSSWPEIEKVLKANGP